MISQRTFTHLSYVVVAIMAACFLLVALGLVPRSWYEYLFAVVLGLFLVRMAFRLALARQARLTREKAPRGNEEGPQGPSSPPQQ